MIILLVLPETSVETILSQHERMQLCASRMAAWEVRRVNAEHNVIILFQECFHFRVLVCKSIRYYPCCFSLYFDYVCTQCFVVLKTQFCP